MKNCWVGIKQQSLTHLIFYKLVIRCYSWWFTSLRLFQVGFFGYVSFCDTDITGDIINHLPSTLVSDVLKLGFVISIAITFPLIIYPCRASLYTLLFPQVCIPQTNF